jgi:nitroimidazol reductase NimA-like FMN-containing flavoprotein (pyridoxamine 5'-phosphate oxidase superfamily)
MSLAMTQEEREAFLADLHVGVVSMNRDNAGPLFAPIWYSYEDGELLFAIGEGSRKSALMNLGDRVSLVAQTETVPYQ